MKLYVGTQNDIIYIIDQPPRPSHDDIADVPGVSIIAKMMASTPEAQRIASYAQQIKGEVACSQAVRKCGSPNAETETEV